MTPSWIREALPFQRKPRRARVARESEALTDRLASRRFDVRFGDAALLAEDVDRPRFE